MRISVICATAMLACALLAAVAFAETQRGRVPDGWQSEGEMHDYFFDMFLGSPGNGVGRMVSPRMAVPDRRLTIECESSDKAAMAMGEYKLDSIELIGIAKHPTPVAFVAGTHGSLSGIQKSFAMPVRDLTSFEQKALADLRGGRTLVSRMDDSSHATVVGAVPARRECVGCHQGAKVGDVLGAFSYRLSAIPTDKSTK